MWEKITALVLLLGATAWTAQDLSWEPALFAFGSLVTLVGLEIRDRKRLQAAISNAVPSGPAPEQLEHDRALFRRFDEILSETRLQDELDRLYTAARTRTPFIDIMSRFLRLSDSAEGKFLVGEVQSTMERLQRNLDELENFIGQKFFSREDRLREEDDWLFLAPHVKTSDSVAFDKEYDHLKKLVDQVARAYKAYRGTTKERLTI